jgi:hypothetical protein
VTNGKACGTTSASCSLWADEFKSLLDGDSSKLVYKGYCDDSRNTDDAG